MAGTTSGADSVAGRYRLSAELGRGGMGIVWLAYDELLDRQVAVKEMRVPAGTDAAEREVLAKRALSEARNAARINHSHAVALYDVVPPSAADGAVYLIMELVRAPTLAQVIQRGGPLPASRAAAIGLQLLDVLDAAHAMGVVHRDVKPANVLLASGDQVKLADFGIAHGLDDPRLTRSGIVGTQAYMAPELFESAAISPPADLWSLGATLFQATAGRGPFDRESAAATLSAILLDDLPAPHCEPPLATAISALLTRDPGRRATSEQVRPLLVAAATATAAAGPTRPVSDAVGWDQSAPAATPAVPPPNAPQDAVFGTSTRLVSPLAAAAHDASPTDARPPAAFALMNTARATELLVAAEQAAGRVSAFDKRFKLLASVTAHMSHIDPFRAEHVARKSKPTGPISGAMRADLLAAAVDGVIGRDPDRARVLLREAEHLASKASFAARAAATLPERAIALAIVAGQYARLDTAKALSLIAEVENMARKIESGPNEIKRNDVLREAARVLVEIDAPRAARIADGMLPDHKSTYTTLLTLADRLLNKDPKTAHDMLVSAQEWLSGLPATSVPKEAAKRDELVFLVVKNLAVIDPARAEQALAGLTRPVPRMMALARLGEALATFDQNRARTHLAEAEQIARSGTGHPADRSRGLAAVARASAPLDPAHARALIAEAGNVLATVADPFWRGTASWHLAACGAGITPSIYSRY